MRSMRGVVRLVAMAAAMALAMPSAARAQSIVSVWLGAGAASTDGSVTFGKDAKQLGVQLDVPLTPLAIRGDALLFGSKLDTDALSYSLNAVFQARFPVVQPYGIVGHGRYAETPTSKVSGWNYGAGVRFGVSRLGLFAEVRKHDPINRTVTVVGLTF